VIVLLGLHRLDSRLPQAKLQLAQSGAFVVDMESYSILEAAHAANIPAAVIRVVSDTADFELPDFNQALNDWRF
jgi:nucleoside phosphorylase